MSDKTLVIRFSAFGDLVLSLKAASALARPRSEARVHFVCQQRYGSLVEGSGLARKTWTLPPSASLMALLRLALRLRHEGYDAVLDLHGNLRSRILCAMLVAPGRRIVRLRRDSLRRRLLVAAPQGLKRILRRRPFETVLERMNSAVAKLGQDLRPAKSAWRYPTAKHGQKPERIGLVPGAAWPEKIWPGFAQLAVKLSETEDVILFGGPGEEALCRSLARRDSISTFCGDKSFADLAAQLADCSVLIAGDTGTAHLAEAVGVPVLVLYGPTVPEFGFAPCLAGSRFLQRDLACRPCSLHGRRPCRFGHGECLSLIEVDEVLAALGEMKGDR